MACADFKNHNSFRSRFCLHTKMSTGNTAQDFYLSLMDKIERARNEPEPNQKLLQLLTNCLAIHDVAESVLTLEKEVRKEVEKCWIKLNTYVHLQLELVQRDDLSQHLKLCEALNERYKILNPVVNNVDSRLEQGLEDKQEAWKKLQALFEKGALERIENVAGHNPDGIEKDLEEIKKKVDGVHNSFQLFKGELYCFKQNFNYEMDATVQQAYSVLKKGLPK